MRLRHVLSLDLMKGYRSFQIILQQNLRLQSVSLCIASIVLRALLKNK